MTPDQQRLRDISYLLDILRWQPTKDGHRGVNAPQWEPLTSAERRMREAAQPRERGDVLSLDEARRRLKF